jgi:hypothetical protein
LGIRPAGEAIAEGRSASAIEFRWMGLRPFGEAIAWDTSPAPRPHFTPPQQESCAMLGHPCRSRHE